MVKKKGIIALAVFVVVFSTILTVCFVYKSDLEIIEHTRHYPNETLVFDDYSFKDDRLLYLACDKDVPSKCKLTQEEFPYASAFRSCNVSLAVDGDLRKESILVVAFGRNRTVLLWEDDKSKRADGTHVRISVVHLDSCEQTEYREYDSFATAQFKDKRKIITYDESFDVFFKNATQCEKSECKLHMTVQGNRLTGSKDLSFRSKPNDGGISQVYSIDSKSPDKGLVYVEPHDEQFDLYLVRNNENQEKYLRTFTGEMKMSVVNGSIGVCSRANITSNTTCLQYNGTNGELKMNFTLSNIDNRTHLESMYTLPEGGFLLSFVDFGKCPKNCDPSVMSNYFILRINAAGKQLGRLYFQGLDKNYIKGIKHLQIYRQPKKEEYCALVVPSRKQSDKLDILVNCFPLSTFNV